MVHTTSLTSYQNATILFPLFLEQSLVWLLLTLLIKLFLVFLLKGILLALMQTQNLIHNKRLQNLLSALVRKCLVSKARGSIPTFFHKPI